MSNTRNDQSFDPTPAELDQLEDDLLNLASHGGWSFMVIDAFGIPFMVETRQGYTGDLCPWYSASDRFVAVDEEQRIHWMHPALEARISCMDVRDFYAEIGRSAKIPELSRRETAETLDENALQMLLRLKARQRVTDPIYKLLRSTAPLSSAGGAQNFLEDTFKNSGLSDTLGWSLAQIALRMPSPGGRSQFPHANPSWQAAILSRLIDVQLAPCPSPEDIRQSLLALAISDEARPCDLISDVHCIATAIAHGVVPAAFEDPRQKAVSDVERTIARIRRGDFDPKEDPTDPAAETPSEHNLEVAIARLLSNDKTVSAHAKIHLIQASNERLAKLGHSAVVNPAKIEVQVNVFDEIPF